MGVAQERTTRTFSPPPASATVSRRPIRVLVVGDDADARATMRRLLQAGGVDACAEAPDAANALVAAARTRPDICLLDFDLPGGGVTAIETIATGRPELPVVVVSGRDDDAHLFDALEAGASGYLLREIDPTRLPIVLGRVLEGEAALPRKLTARLIEEFGNRRRRSRLPRIRDLTSRELDVLELLHRGLTTAQIGRRLFIAPVTVRSHVASIVKKLGVSDREAAIRMLEDADQPTRAARPRS